MERIGINLLGIGDIHFGAPKCMSSSLLTNFRTFVYPYLTEELDVLIFDGDYFDSALDLNRDASYDALLLIEELVEIAKIKGFLIRVLNGTFYHDRDQVKFFNLNRSNLKNKHGDRLIKIVSTIDIEWIEGLQISILYKPDDLPFKNGMSVINKIVSDSGMKQVDIMVNHGYFNHLLPYGIPHVPANTLDFEKIDGIVKGVVFNGHYHTPTVYKKVINTGSFDRLNHGEEEAKGFFIVSYDPKTSKSVYQFVENEFATTFKTIDISKSEQEFEGCVEYVTKCMEEIMQMKSTTVQKYVRVMGDNPDIRQAIVAFISTTYPNVIVSSKAKTKNNGESDAELLEQLELLEDMPIITKNNVADMVNQFLIDRGTPLNKAYIDKTILAMEK
jgi:DNA repair exonuclease SbcCD nuclease subunit